jgi:hypothetical protein
LALGSDRLSWGAPVPELPEPPEPEPVLVPGVDPEVVGSAEINAELTLPYVAPTQVPLAEIVGWAVPGWLRQTPR